MELKTLLIIDTEVLTEWTKSILKIEEELENSILQSSNKLTLPRKLNTKDKIRKRFCRLLRQESKNTDWEKSNLKNKIPKRRKKSRKPKNNELNKLWNRLILLRVEFEKVPRFNTVIFCIFNEWLIY